MRLMTSPQKLFFTSWLVASLATFTLRTSSASANSEFEKGLNTSVNQLIEKFGESDKGSYLRLAEDLSKLHVQPNNLWVINLWPPGQSALEALNLLFTPFNFVISMMLASSIIWSLPAALLLISFWESSVLKAKAYGIASASAWLFSPFGLSIIQTPSQVFAADGNGAALLTSAIILLFRENSRDKPNSINKWSLFLGGALLAAAQHFRWAFVGISMLVLLVPALGFLAQKFILNYSGSTLDAFLKRNAPFAAGLLVGVIPWTLVALTLLHPGNPTWSASDYIWAQRWILDSDLIQQNAPWAVEGGLNWACHVAPLTNCQEMRILAMSGDSNYFPALRSEALKLIFEHPVSFLNVRISALPKFWFSASGVSLPVVDVILGWFSLLMIVLLSILVYMRKSTRSISSMGLAFIACLFAPPLIEHWESRYLQPLFSLALITTIFCLRSGKKFKSAEDGFEKNREYGR